MTIKYSLDQDDYLEHLLFITSKSKEFRKNRILVSVIVTSLIALIGILFYVYNNNLMALYCGVCAIIFLVILPSRLARRFKIRFLKHILETYKNAFGEEITLSLEDLYIDIQDINGVSKINYSALEEIIEIPNHILIKLKTGNSLIIPKKKIIELDHFKMELQILMNKLAINYAQELDWKWK
jgi:hypothetical protein